MLLWQTRESYRYQISDSSLIMSGISQGSLLPGFNYNVNGTLCNELYFLIDGIFPPYYKFVTNIANVSIRKESAFVSAKEALGEDVERALGV